MGPLLSLGGFLQIKKDVKGAWRESSKNQIEMSTINFSDDILPLNIYEDHPDFRECFTMNTASV